ncbi:DUF4326 domain-containing protein [Amycolatopsis anabasis]|uniref:DUF4326 domain-containing protein n=1 Tax=Amycolatopsis anabasis TaxID=1840409 RepID=UPI001C554BDC|nr:DUF4326 domain-containing protein [Amycolatopsis anabasis]
MTEWSDDELARWELLDAGVTVCVSMRRGVHPHLIAWAKHHGLFVRIDRASKWGNPFVLGRDGDRDTVVRRFEFEYLPYQPTLLAALGELRAKALGCWCAPELCHGEPLAVRAGQPWDITVSSS